MLLLMFAASLCTCKPSDQVALGTDLTHSNGLVAAPPLDFLVEETEQGFLFTEAGNVRSPQRIRIEVVAEPPSLRNASTREVEGQQWLYRIAEHGSGSGGIERELVVHRPGRERHIVLTALEQAEGAPSFEEAWTVLEHARLAR
jgi:hypothetical protein